MMESTDGDATEQYRSEQERMNLKDNLLRRMLIARKESNQKKHLEDAEILSNSFTFMLAGHDTTSHTVSWMLYYIATLPAVQQAVQQEVQRVCGGPGGRLPSTPKEVESLEVIAGCFREALRDAHTSREVAMASQRRLH